MLLFKSIEYILILKLLNKWLFIPYEHLDLESKLYKDKCKNNFHVDELSILYNSLLQVKETYW
jgi:hypothetical protein